MPATETLRPPGAVPPPPRAIPPTHRGTITRPLPALRLEPEGQEVEKIPQSAPAPTFDAEPSVHPQPRAQAPEQASPFSSGGSSRSVALRPSSRTPPTMRALWESIVLLGGRGSALLRFAFVCLGVGLLFIAWRGLRSGDSKADTAQVDIDGAGQQAGVKPLAPCATAGAPRKLAETVQLSVPLLTHGEASGRIALAYASTPTTATGLTLDPVTLDAAQALSEEAPDAIFAVLPHGSASAGTQFTTLRTSAGVTGGGLVRLPSGTLHLTIGRRGFEAVLGDQREAFWPEAAAAKTTSPRAEALGSSGAIVTLRRGGLDGQVLVGLLDDRGRARGALVKVAATGEQFGTPSVSVGTEEVLVSFASRASPEAPWRMELARAPVGQLPAASRPFVPNGVEETTNTLSPAATALAGGGWLLQWTQGTEGTHRVWLQTLDAKLEPLGPPIPAGPEGAESGQGTPWADSEGRAASFYIVRTGQLWELWGTALKCPR